MQRAVLAILLAVLASAPTGHAQAQRRAQLWYQAYEAGVRDIARGAWDSAAQNLQAAKQTGPAPARRVVFYGDLVDVFNPDYYLGVAYLNLRRFADADAAFERVRQGNLMPASDKQYGAFQTQAATAKAEIALAQAEDHLANGNDQLAAEAANRAATLGVARARVQDLQQRITARQALARDAAGATRQAAATPAQPAPPAAVDPQPTPTPIPLPNAAVAQLPLQQKAPPLTNAAPGPNPPAQQTSKSDGPVVASNALSRAPQARPTTSPAGTERDGIAAFFSGRYDEAARTLAAVAGGPQSSARARFYLACSLAAQVLTGDRDQSELTSARAQLREAGRLDQFASDRRLISPRVLAVLSIQQ